MDANKPARRQKAHETLINIAGISKRLHTGLARANADLQGISARTRLEKIVVASKSVLAESLGNDSFLDPRLEDWLCSKEPDMCLHILSDMERLIATDLHDTGRSLWGKVTSAIYSLHSGEGRVNEAIRLFSDRQHFFRFLLTPEVWNRETDIRPQPGAAPYVVPKIGRSDMVLVQTNIDVALSGRESWESRVLSTIADETKRRIANKGEEQKNEIVDSEKLDTILRWLDGLNCNEKHEDVVSLRQDDTCVWLPETDQYKMWKSSDDSFLWLHGKAGAGKTVLAASVIEGIRKTLQDGESIVFFYCDFRDERTSSAAAVMRSILSQLLRKLRNGTGRDLIQLVDDMVNWQTDGTLVLTRAGNMAPLVSRAARLFSRQPFVVLDGLDECRDVESLLDALCWLRKGGMRLFVTSRPLQVIKDKFHELPSISMDRMAKEVSADIGLHVARVIDGDRRLSIFEEKVKTEILVTLLRKADGMFRWAQCQIDTLKKCATTRDIRIALYSIPSSLDETYERILRAIDLQSSDGKVALRALVWLVAALRPLQLAEILEALSIDLCERRLDHEIAPVHGYALLDALGSLVMYNEESGVINLSHFSVKEYLIGTQSLAKLTMYHIDLPMAHAQVALLCMCYVAAVTKHWALPETEAGLQVPSDQRNGIILLSKSYPLLHYAFSHGFRHILRLESGNPAVIDGMIALRLDIERHAVGWRRMCELATLCPRHPYLSGLAAQHDFIICILISLLPEPFLRTFLRRAPFKALDGTSPLIYATYFDKIEHARTLLSRGVSHVNTPGLDVERPHQVLPLEVAFHHRRHSLFVLFLLDWRATVPPRLFSSVFYEHYLSYTPRDAAMLLQCDEFAEWVQADAQRGQSLLHPLGYDLRLIVQSVSEKEVLSVLRRLAQVGCDLSRPDSLESVLAVFFGAASKRSLQIAILLYLRSLDVPIPSRALLTGRTALVQELTLRGLDVNTIMSQSDIALRLAFGECKHGSSCWAPDCKLCSVFLQVLGPQFHVPNGPVDVLLVGRKGVGKGSLVNMILGIPDDFPGAAQVTNGSASKITSYATLLGSLPVQIWDTPGLDKAQDDYSVRGKINDWLRQVSSSHRKHDLETGRPYFNLPTVQVVWCMHAGEINDPAAWQQFLAIYEESRHRRGVISTVLVNQLPTQSAGDWEEQCEIQLQRLGLSADSTLLKSVRSHRGVYSPEYKDDSQALSQFIRQHALRVSTGDIKLDHLHGDPLAPYRRSDSSFRCIWVTIHPESICNCIVRHSDLPNHLHLCHGVKGSSRAVVTCRWRGCNKDMSGQRIVRHIRMMHLDQGNGYVCTNCGKHFSSLESLRRHMELYHYI